MLVIRRSPNREHSSAQPYPEPVPTSRTPSSLDSRPCRYDHAEAHFALGMSLGRLDQFDDAAEHVAKAASLGDRQALDMLPNIGADDCRTCSRAVRFSQIDNPDADITVGTHGIGWTCADCRTVLCGICVSGGQAGPFVRACPDCGGRLRILT